MIDVIGPIVIGVITAVILAAIVGYILNIVKLFRSFRSFRTNGPLTPIFFGRILGLVIPVIGSVVGYMK